jgi:hypothetical protein
MVQDRGEATQLHLQPSAGLIKKSTDAMHNRWVDTKIKWLPPHLSGGTWHPTYTEQRYAGQNLYQLKHRYRRQLYRMQGLF